jgi:hypothetical protein
MTDASIDQQQRFQQGHEVGELAHRMFPGGVLVDNELEFEEHIARSSKLLQLRQPLFEAAFSIPGAYARADVLNPVGDRQWDLIEVKSASNVWSDSAKTKVKEVYLDDIAFQLFVFERSGIDVRRCALLSVNTGYVRRGSLSPEDFFLSHDVSQEVRAKLAKVAGDLDRLLVTLTDPDEPSITIGAHCHKPYECEVVAHCWRDVPANSVHTLYRIGAKAHEMWRNGVRTIVDIPKDVKLTRRQQIQVDQELAGMVHLEKESVQEYIRRLQFPLSFLDFETFQLAIPPYDGCRPYTQIPFQYSLHVIDAPGNEPIHYDFLGEGSADPRPALVEALRKQLPGTGSIITYNAVFEMSRLKELALCFPEYSDWVTECLPRIEASDLLHPFREFHVYHPQQFGSASIKSVLPLFSDISYDDLAIRDGSTAAAEFLRLVKAEDADATRDNLRNYCRRDTFAMVRILERLRELVL